MAFSGALGRSLAVAFLALWGIVAAFATIAPGGEEAPPASVLVVEPLPLQLHAAPADGAYVREEQFQRGDTLAGFLERLGVDDNEAVSRLVRMPAVRALRPGANVRADLTCDGAPIALSFLTGRDTLVRIEPQGDGFRASEEQAPLETRIAMKANVIRSSLFAATDAVGIPDGIAIQLADVFGGDIDFHRDLRIGDRFTVVYEVYDLRGRPVRAGRLLAAEFVNQGRTLRAVRFGSGYYAPDGKNLRKAFLRSPLEFSRISSGFGMRKHPIQKIWKSHKGTDYAAPIGTRVRAVADAVVEFAGVKSGYGNVVILRHNGQYSTVYAHLSRSAVHRGQRVAQSDTIGYVGQTGWATGPHLHYEFRVAGQARNPLSIALPAALPLPAQDLATFRTQVGPLIARLDLVAQGDLAQLE